MTLTGKYKEKLFLLSKAVADKLLIDCEGKRVDCKIVLWEAQRILTADIDKMKEGENGGSGRNERQGTRRPVGEGDGGNNQEEGEKTLPTSEGKASKRKKATQKLE